MDTFSALSDPTRRSILELLAASGPLPASEIYDHFTVSRPAISQHLQILRQANLVLVERKAQFRIYRINPQPMQELESWVQKLAESWEERFTALDRVLQKEQARQVQARHLPTKNDQNQEGGLP